LEGTVDSQFDVGDAEWDGHTMFRGFDAGKKLKATSGWGNGGNGTDDYGFGMIPSSYQGTTVWIWTSTEETETNAWVRKIQSDQDGVYRRDSFKTYGDVVRCINDCTPQPTQADAGADQLDIVGTSTTLEGNTPISGTGVWTIESGTGGTITDSGDPESEFSGVAGLSYDLVWTISTECALSADTVVIGFENVVFNCGDQLTDLRDGQDYATVLIGGQCWMAENLNVGTRLDGVEEQTDDGAIEKYCYDDDELDCDEYGGLYQWNEMMQYSTFPGTEGICPTGWHIPTDNEWKTLEGTVDGLYPVGDPEWDETGYRGFDAGKNLKSIEDWNTNTGTDLFGFTALPGGIRLEGGSFGDVMDLAYMYSSSLDNGTQSVNVDASSDLLWKLGDKTTGEYVVSYYLYFPSGNYGYYNIQHFEDHDPFESAIECNFHTDGSGELKAGGQITAFSYNHDQWFLVEHIINLDSDVASCYINGAFIYTWQWSIQSDGNSGTNQLGSVDFYPNVSGSGTPAYYIDDVYYFDGSSVLNWDDFESYTLASYIAAENPTWWTTWSGTTGGAEDGVIVDEQANSGAYAWSRIVDATSDQVDRGYKFKERGYSVRCLLGECTPQPSQADAGPDQLNVEGTSVTLAGNTPASGTGNWAVISGVGGTIADADSPTSSFSGLAGNSYELAWTITTDCGSSTDTVAISFVGADGVMKVSSKVAIDGLLEESFWDISYPITINLGGSDNTANFGVLWDENYLYIGVSVVDGTLCTNLRQGWYDDGVEIYINGDFSQGTSFDEYDRRFVKPVKSYWIQEADGYNDGVVHQWFETMNGYSMEFAIPWANFNITPAAGMNIGFNVAINDDDDCTSNNSLSQLLWYGDASYYNDPSTWGILNLSDETVSYSGDYIALMNPNGSDFLVDGQTSDIKWVSNGITNINIEYSTDNGSNWNSIVSNQPAVGGTYNWDISATASEQCLVKIYDANNAATVDVSENAFTISAALTTLEPMIPNTWKNYKWPYNAYYPEDPQGINGHVGNACGHSSIARILHYWEFPIVGNDELTFTDNGGFTWSANFGETTYNYDNMPPYLHENSSEPEYTDVATLFYHSATSMHDVWGNGTNLDNMSYAMSHYFNYNESTETWREDYTRDEWIQTVMEELDNGRVLLIKGMTTEVLGDWRENNNIAGHWYHVDGYNEEGQLHVIVGFGNYDGYYDADSMSGFSINLGTLIGLEPNLNDKELSILSPDGGEVYIADSDSVITWASMNISDLKIEYTTDNGENWIEITSSTSASAGTYSWSVPDLTSYQCKVRLTDVTDVNVYDKSDDVFAIADYELELVVPNGGACYVPGNIVSVSWIDTPVLNIMIEYSTDNGANWTEIIDSTPTSSGSYDWVVPNTISDECKVRISDVLDETVNDESDNTFEITDEAPYALQFDGTDDYVKVIDIPFPEDDLTIEAWIKPNGFEGYQEVVFWFGDNSIQLRTQSDSSLLYGEAAAEWNYVGSASQTLLPEVWTHIAITKDDDQCKLYINGINVAFSEFDNDPVASEVNIGSRTTNMDRCFDGAIDEVRIWDVARSVDEIQANMYNYMMGSVSGLLACWRMNEGAGQTLTDLTSNGYDGQLGSTTGTDDNDPDWLETDWPFGDGGAFSCGDLLIDSRDASEYETVLIGTQCWMAENLNIGTRIDGGIDATEGETIEKYCYDDNLTNCDLYGGLYQWNELMQYSTSEGTQGICPDGWSVPTDLEWKTLEGFVDSNYPVGDPVWDNTGWRGQDAGKHLKSSTGWSSNSGDDLYGFTALPGGMVEGAVFKDLIGYTYLWTSTDNGNNAWFRALAHDRDDVYRSNFSKSFGCSLRCIKD